MVSHAFKIVFSVDGEQNTVQEFNQADKQKGKYTAEQQLNKKVRNRQSLIKENGNSVSSLTDKCTAMPLTS